MRNQDSSIDIVPRHRHVTVDHGISDGPNKLELPSIAIQTQPPRAHFRSPRRQVDLIHPCVLVVGYLLHVTNLETQKKKKKLPSIACGCNLPVRPSGTLLPV